MAVSDDDYGLDSGDESELVALTEVSHNTAIKRKEPPTDEDSQSKKAAIEAYPSSSPLAFNTLTQRFRLRGFHLKQEAVIARILAGGSAVVVFPTGGGKSLCYQIPALTFAEVDKSSKIRGAGESGITLGKTLWLCVFSLISSRGFISTVSKYHLRLPY